MNSSGTKISDLKAAIINEPGFYEIMQENLNSGEVWLEEYARNTIAVREDAVEWMLGHIDPGKLESVKDWAMLVGTLRFRLDKLMVALAMGFADDPAIKDAMWDI